MDAKQGLLSFLHSGSNVAQAVPQLVVKQKILSSNKLERKEEAGILVDFINHYGRGILPFKKMILILSISYALNNEQHS